MGRSDRHKKRKDQIRGKKKAQDMAEKITFPKELIEATVGAFKKGKTVLYPTDTVYGLGCDATNYDAVEKIFDLKKRPKNKSLIVLVDSFNMLESVVDNIPEMAWEVLKVNKKPLTIIYDNPKNVTENVVAQDGSLAVRVTNDPFCRAIIRRLRKPIVSTSANISGQPTPESLSDVDEAVKNDVEHIVDLPLAHKKTKPSSIMKISNGGVIKIIRK